MDDSKIVAVDLGGTNSRAAIVDCDGNIVKQVKNPVNHDEPEPTVVIDSIKEVMAGEDVGKAVIGIPGIIDYELQQAVHVPNLPQNWIPKLSAEWLGSHTDLEVGLANDADLAAVGEAKFGAAKNYNDMVYVTISTGIGGGAVLGGKLVHGKYAANDIGHVMVDLSTTESGRYTPETYGSGPNLEAQARDVGLEVTTKELVELVRSGDEKATQVFDKGIRGAAAGIVNLAWLYAPAAIVIGGGVGLNADVVLPRIEELLASYGPDGVEPAKLLSAELGDSVALVGAAGWWEAFSQTAPGN